MDSTVVIFDLVVCKSSLAGKTVNQDSQVFKWTLKNLEKNSRKVLFPLSSILMDYPLSLIPVLVDHVSRNISLHRQLFEDVGLSPTKPFQQDSCQHY